MKITSDIFAAFLKCSTKCYLRWTGQAGSGNAYADWVRAQNDAYRGEATNRLMAGKPEAEVAVAPPAAENLKAAKWRLAFDLLVQAGDIESCIHAVERVPSESRGRPVQFIPVRFVFFNKLTKDDRLLMAFDALVLSEVLGREVATGKIIHGDDHASQKINIAALAGKVRKFMEKVTALVTSKSPPDLILNRHCSECEFRNNCRQRAVEKDDLSLLSCITEKDRQRYNNKGIFTVAQLSYTFRPRRRPKRLSEKRERYHPALKALAIRAQKIHVIGSPAVPLDGTPVYLDVEGFPDTDFYYLIGVRFQTASGIVRRSLWADNFDSEKQIWADFLNLLEGIEKPVLLHYGSYETTFLKKMCTRHGQPPQDSLAAKAIRSTVNVLSLILGQFYFPTYADSLKHIAAFLGFDWAEPDASGLKAIVWRKTWETTKATEVKNHLLNYNQEDCNALERTTIELRRLCLDLTATPKTYGKEVVEVSSLRTDSPLHFGKMEFAVPDFEPINRAAYWDYNRNRIRIRDHDRAESGSTKRTRRHKPTARPNTKIEGPCASSCPSCNDSTILRMGKVSKVVQDLRFTATGMKRWYVKHVGQRYRCAKCGSRFVLLPEGWPHHPEGSGLSAFVIYQLIEHRVSQRSVADLLMELFRVDRPRSIVNRLKARAACIYKKTCEQMMHKLVTGHVIHADETAVSIGGKRMYVWVFCNSEETVYYPTSTREADFPKQMLNEFKGVLVSDFYPAYDSIRCPQQKCLIHLMRDLNNDLLKAPFDQEVRSLAFEFGAILKEIIETIDRFGLKVRFLKRHKKVVARFYRELAKRAYRSDTAAKYQDRLQKEQGRLFVFLDHDGIPWNNNNAEHAIKSFAMLRTAIGGSSTENGLADYLVLLSVLETCKSKGLSFLGFLRSGELDIDTFADRKGSARPSHR